MAKRKTTDVVADIRKALEEKKVVIGAGTAIKNLKLGKTELVYLSQNCPKNTTEDIEHYAKIGNIKVVKLSYPNDELGVLCKKPFSISVLSVLRERK